MAADRTFRFNEDLQGLSGDAIIELFAIDLYSGVQKIPETDDEILIDWENGQAICDAFTIADWEMSDCINDGGVSLCTDAPDYDSPVFAPGTAEYDDADIEPRNQIDSQLFKSKFFFFCNWVVTDGQPVKFGGNVYLPIPYKAEGFEYRNEGVLPNPKVTISNIGLEPTAMINAFNDLLGAKVYRRRVLAKHLDDGSQPDVNSRWPDEVWYIQQKTEENKLYVTFELSTPFDLDGVTLPRRRALRYACPWVYRSGECGYSGPPVADLKDNPTNDPKLDKCGKRVTSCQLRFTDGIDLPYGGFPGLTLN